MMGAEHVARGTSSKVIPIGSCMAQYLSRAMAQRLRMEAVQQRTSAVSQSCGQLNISPLI